MSPRLEKTPTPSAPGVHPRRWWSLRPASDREAGDAVVSNFLLHWFPAKSFKASLVVELLLLARHRVGGAAAAARPVGAAAALPLHPLGRTGVRLGQGHRVRHHVRLVDPRGPPDLGAPHGRGRLPAPRARLPDRRLQERHRPEPEAGVELGHRRRDAAPDALPVVHRIPAALGPARLLGRHGRHQHRLVGAPDRARDARAADRRAHDRAGDAHPLLRPARPLPAHADRRPLRVPHVARPQGRRPRARRPRAARGGEGGAARLEVEDLHAARHRARDFPAGPRLDHRGAGRDRQLRAGPDAPHRHRHPRHDRARRDPLGLRAVAARGAGQSAHHPQSRQGALVLPLAPGNRHRHDDPPRLLHDQRRLPRRRAAARSARRADDPLALARPEPRRRGRRTGSPRRAGARTSSSCCSSSACSP